ncbi:ABC transporter, ATP-binding protein [Planococcus sp. PAMC 21323]|uniref:ABC transporter ATP-binding protein n=1 Tax=Planococcus sp. PAMC 21323 TaxID=1526927 RepID=UPI000571A036|nr:ABC transporter ATP-binding protein [Planococcus sp. PAMC 21323]AIY04540.1 ABC transporter, ATP-binding protein [Planococcus sp. PAMC 21323]
MVDILQVKGLYKEFNETKILKGINFSVKAGEFVAIMGRSGSGKSTLLYNISGMDRATSGEIIFDGENISKFDDEKISHIRLQKMGFIFQKSHLLKTLSIRDNIVFPGFKANSESRENVNKYAEELMRRTGIDHVGSHDIKEVSGGQLQRAAICRAIINHPNIIFGDEPTGSLNSLASKEIMDILNEINKTGTVVILVTHDPKIAARADRVIFLSDGNIIDEITLDKYEAENFLERENKMVRWLAEQVF